MLPDGDRRIWLRQARRQLATPQALFLLGANAIVSLIISVLVVTVALQLGGGGAETPVAEAPAEEGGAPVAAAATGEPVTPGPTVRALPTEPSVAYVVKPGDTLFGIATEFGVSIEELMRANNLQDPNVLSLGQTLAIPVPGTPAPTPTLLSPDAPALAGEEEAAIETPTPGASPAPPTPVPQEVRVQIIGVFHSADESSTSPVGETVVILNRGLPVDLEGWALADSEGNAYTFPSLELATGDRIRVHSGSGQDSGEELYWGRSSAVWGEGDTATLEDPDGEVMSSYQL